MPLGIKVDFIEVKGVAVGVFGAYGSKITVTEGYMPSLWIESHLLVSFGELGQRLNGDILSAFGHVIAAVVFAGESGIGTDHELVKPELFGNHLLYLLQRGLFRFVAGKDDERQRYAVGVHQKSHLHNGVGTVFLGFAPAAAYALGPTGMTLVDAIGVIVFYLKVIVRAVIKRLRVCHA